MRHYPLSLLLTSLFSTARSEVPRNPIPEPEATYWSTDITVIAPEKTETNSEGFSLKVKNSTFKRNNNKLYMELGLTVEGPP